MPQPGPSVLLGSVALSIVFSDIVGIQLQQYLFAIEQKPGQVFLMPGFLGFFIQNKFYTGTFTKSDSYAYLHCRNLNTHEQWPAIEITQGHWWVTEDQNFYSFYIKQSEHDRLKQRCQSMVEIEQDHLILVPSFFPFINRKALPFMFGISSPR